MTQNLLKFEISPYLLQHQDNPVHWQPWGKTALDQASKENKPVLLSIGYAACHWCHVMAHESFEDTQTANVMNSLFINIKVDREERPDIDRIYMNAIHIMGEQGGWPLTMFLTPDGVPFWGGTYFPKKAQYGRPGFIQVLTQISEIYHTQPDKISTNSKAVKQALSPAPRSPDKSVLTPVIIETVASQLLKNIDFTNGGLQGAPKFPQTVILEFLSRAGVMVKLPEYQDAVQISLTHMCQGGIFDHIGGGFSRYSVDEFWLVPHFEKMLYDNALIIDALCRAYQNSSNPLFQLRIEETIEWLEREMKTDDGLFSASLNADSEGIEGKFYVWSDEEIKQIIKNNYPQFARHYDVSPSGNWENTNILNRLHSMKLLDSDSESSLARDRKKLLAERSRRIPPSRDDKALTDWNALLISALTTASNTLKNPRWLELAKSIFSQLFATLSVNGTLHHVYRLNKVQIIATSEDYAYLIRCSLDLYQATFDNSYLQTATELEQSLYTHFWDTRSGGYFFTSNKAETLIVRTRSPNDDATPNTNGVMAQNLVKLYLLTAKQEYLVKADHIFTAFTPDILQHPFACISLLNAFDTRLKLITIVFVKGARITENQSILSTVRAAMPSSATLLIPNSDNPLDTAHPAYDKSAINEVATVYICHNNTCTRPLLSENEIIRAISEL